MSLIKICGLRREADIEYANILQPDFIGFVFAGKKRKIDIKTAEKLKSRLDNKIKSVGVFVNEDINLVASLANNGIIDLIQLHGDEDINYINKLKFMSPRPVIRAVRVRSRADINNALALPVDYLLLDTYVEKGIYGGTGKRFDTNLIPEELHDYFLAGGLDAGNLEETIKLLNPYCVDISSGVEDVGYIKNFDKMKEVVDIVRRTN
ncbi:MAG: phosphoribosylanthranilate isomerase [Eubacterium sp.]